MKKLFLYLLVFISVVVCITNPAAAQENTTITSTTILLENVTTTTIIPNETSTTSSTTIPSETTTISSANETENITTTTTVISLNETTTTSTTIQETTILTTLETTTSTLPPKPKDEESPIWVNLRHDPKVVRESDSVNIIVGWYDNVALGTVIIYENSTGSWEEHICNIETGHCSSGITNLSTTSANLTGLFLVIVFATTFTILILNPMKAKGISKIVLPFLVLVISIFLLSILLFPEVSRNISLSLSRLGILPLRGLRTFSHTIPASELDAGEVVGYYSYANDTAGNEATSGIKTFTVQTGEVILEEIETSSIKEEQGEAEIGKPVKWKKELVIVNPFPEEIKGYEVTDLPKDAENIVVKDVEGRILYRNKSTWTTDITEKGEISYFAEYETSAPYKEESITKPFVLGRTYKKRINVKSDFSGHYQNVKAYTDISEEIFQENYKIKLYHLIGNSKIDVTDNPSYEVKFIDSDNNGFTDRIEWTVPQLSEEEFEVKAGITIINVQSYPAVWGNWTVRFNTTGVANLTITPINNTNFDVDIKFLELKCGDNVVNPVYDGRSVFYYNWNCSEEGKIINQVLKPGKHTLEFRYGDDVEYAHNLALFFDDFETGFGNWVDTGGTCYWIRDQGGTPSSSTGPDHDNTIGDATGWYIYVENSLRACQGSDTSAIIEGPDLDADMYSVSLSFYYHMYGSNIGTLHVDVYDGSWHDDEWNISGQQHGSSGAAYTQAQVDLGSYTGIIKIRFRYDGVTGFRADAAIDDINITGVSRNQPPTTPTNMRCNGNDNCDIDVDTGVTLQAGGSTDADGDTITYYLEALLDNTITSDDQEPGEQEHKAETTTGITTYNFATCTHGTDCWAYENDVDQFPFGGNTANRNDHAEPTAAEYTYMSAVNGQWMTDDPGAGDEMLLWLEFYIDLGESPIEDITLINFSFFGNTDGSAATDYTIWVLRDGEAWQTDASWTQLGGSTSVPQDVDTWVNRSLDSNFATYINSGTGLITWAVFSNRASEDMRVNYVEMKVSYGTTKDDDYNETFIEYTAIDGPDLGSITSIEVITQVSYYDPRGSVNTGNTRPDLEIGIWDGSIYDTGHLCDLVSYYGDSESSVKYNCIISITDPIIRTAWETASNRKVEIRGDFLDSELGFDDTIRWDSVWAIINGKERIEIGSHVEGSSFYWDTSGLEEQNCIDLRTRAIDLTGSNTYSSYFTKGCCLNITHGGISWLNVILDVPNPNIYTASNPLEVSQYNTFTVNATVECKDGSCGTVSGSVRYNDSLGEPNPLVSTIKGTTPFYIVGETYQTRDDDYIYKNWNFSVSSQVIGNPSGVAYNGTHFWVIDRSPGNAKIFRYDKNGNYDGWSKDCSAEDTALEGIYVNSTTIGITGYQNSRVYFYDINTGNFITSFDVSAEMGTAVPASLVFNSTYVWVLASSTTNKRVYRYLSGVHDWDFDYNVVPGVTVIGDGLEFNGTHFFVSDSMGTGGHVWAYNSAGNYVYWNFSTVEEMPYGLTYYDNENNFYTVDYSDKYVRRYERNTTSITGNPVSCGSMNQGDICRLNWTVNVTGSSDYKIDVNFSSSNYLGVANNDTLNAYIKVSALSFSIKLPGRPWISSSKTKPGTLTTPINFSAVAKTEYNVVPCVYSSNYCQDATTPIFNFTNTGGKAEKWNISLSQALPSYIHLYGNTSSNSTLQEINISGWIVANNIPVGGYAQAWLWADFVDVPPGKVEIAINHTSMTAT